MSEGNDLESRLNVPLERQSASRNAGSVNQVPTCDPPGTTNIGVHIHQSDFLLSKDD